MNDGKIVVFHSDTSYALGVNAYNLKGIERIYKIKERDNDKPLSILANDLRIEEWALVDETIQECIKQIVNTYWPGPVSIILPKRELNGKAIIPSEVTAGINSIHLVCMDQNTKLLSSICKNPIAVTSANLSGEELIIDPITAIQTFGNSVDLILIGNESKFKQSTNIVDFTQKPPKIVRLSSDIIKEELLKIIPDLQ